MKPDLLSGYDNLRYAESLFETGSPLRLEKSGSWVIRRKIAHTSMEDGMGGYPIFACKNWRNLSNDLRDLSTELVSITLVTDPFGEYTFQLLKDIFQDVVIPFKDHYIIDLNLLPDQFVSEHHRYYSRKSLREIKVGICPDPEMYLDSWCELYDVLTKRHDIKGIAAFSRIAFEIQFSVPGLHVFYSAKEGNIVAMQLWYEMGDRVYYHLNASNTEGYQSNASYGMMWTAIEYFKSRGFRWINLGAGAGLDNRQSGLTAFKKGWSTSTRQVYLCGKIMNPDFYRNLVNDTSKADNNFFPAYRLPAIVNSEI